MESYLNMGLNIVRIARIQIGSIIYNLSTRVKSEGFLATLTGTLDDDNTWIIDSGASRHMTRERVQLHTLSKEPSSHAVDLGDKTTMQSRALDLHN